MVSRSGWGTHKGSKFPYITSKACKSIWFHYNVFTWLYLNEAWETVFELHKKLFSSSFKTYASGVSVEKINTVLVGQKLGPKFYFAATVVETFCIHYQMNSFIR